MQHLKLYLVQANLTWENSTENLRHLGHLISGIPENSLIILPEMFATGFTMKPEKYAQKMDGEAVKWMCENSTNKAICGSLSISENNSYFNRFLWAENGEIKAGYDKRHLFTHGSEMKHYTAGTVKITVEYQGWKILPFVCYDLRFPAWCRNTEQAELMLFVANWPQVRIKAWEKLLQARAIENQCFVVGVNRVGEDGNGIYHNGSSMVCDAWGEILVNKHDNEEVIHMELNPEKLMEFRRNFPVLEDADRFEIGE
ncbi:MAG: amidohydrolase [Bacteroidetes bacterium]|nr:amidohydrolase [Bacteroidota bacterium]